jgi:hypothetical protein
MIIQFDIPDVAAARIIDGLSLAWSYPTEVMGQPNPQSKGQFVKQKLIQYIKDEVRHAEMNVASETSREELAAINIS